MVDSLLASVQTGQVAPLGPDAVPSAFVKAPRQDSVAVTLLGLQGDEQADLDVHGGPEKAVYAYAAAHYPAWAKLFPALTFKAGAMGENFTILGLTETGICVGDVHRIGSALLQVCQPRQPCFKFALRHGNKHLPKAMVKTGLAGWYYRVLQTGFVKAGDALALHERPHPDFSFSRLIEIIYHGGATKDELHRMVAMPGLSSQWRMRAHDLLDGPA